jgi:hypothetical protein
MADTTRLVGDNPAKPDKKRSMLASHTEAEVRDSTSESAAAVEEAGREDEHLSRRINRKLDVALLPLLSLLYLFNGLDRSNVGNAQTQGKH